MNFGFWGTVPLPPGARTGYYNRRVEAEVAALGGRKSLYSTSFYSPERVLGALQRPGLRGAQA